jgi:hypothetical protein
MPTFRKGTKHARHPWQARAKRLDIEYGLGYYSTREEAVTAERKFSAHYPPDARGKRAIHVRENA